MSTPKIRIRKLILAKLLLLSFALPASSVIAEEVICGKTFSLATRDEQFAQSAKTLDFARSIAGDQPFIYVKHCASHEDFQEWMVYPSSKKLQARLEKELGYDVANGFMIQMDPASSKRFLERSSLTGNKTGILDFLEEGDEPALVLIEGDVPIPYEYLRRAKERAAQDGGTTPTLIRIPSTGPNAGTTKFAALLKATPEDVGVIFLLPRNPSEAANWKMDEDRRNDFVSVGKKLAKDLEVYKANVAFPTSKDSFDAAVRRFAGKKHIIVLGESRDKGSSILIPKSEQIIASKDLEAYSASGPALYGFFCYSERLLPTDSGLTTLNPILTTQSRAALQFIMDKRPAASSEEYAIFDASDRQFVARLVLGLFVTAPGGGVITSPQDDKDKASANGAVVVGGSLSSIPTKVATQ
jgi:hypothetical protein